MKKLLILVVVSLCALGAWRLLRGGSATDGAALDDSKLALDRVWIDQMPRTERDQVSVFIAITEEPIGVFQTSSVWKGAYELFRYGITGNELRVLYPQDGSREQIKVTARRCDENSFDYCLELAGASRGVKRYYSRKGWEIDGATRADQIAERVRTVLPAALEPAPAEQP